MSEKVFEPALQVQDTSDEFDRLLALHKIAQEAFVKLSSVEAASKALRARSRPQRILKTGDVVYARGLLQEEEGTWCFEASHADRVLAMEASCVWVSVLGELWRAAAEQVCKEATTVERMVMTCQTLIAPVIIGMSQQMCQTMCAWNEGRRPRRSGRRQ